METEPLEKLNLTNRRILKGPSQPETERILNPQMDDPILITNITGLQNEIEWLLNIISDRIIEYSEGKSHLTSKTIPDMYHEPQLPDCSYNDFVIQQKLSYLDRLLIILAFSVNITPDITQPFLSLSKEGKYRPFGGIINKMTNQFIPTLQTALFLLGGENFKLTVYHKIMLTEKYHLFKEQIISLYYEGDTEYTWSDPGLVLSPSYRHYFITGERPCLDHGTNFPADLLETDKTFDDLVVKESILQDLTDIKNYVDCHETLFTNDDAKRKLSPGYVAMFYGPPGTGKSLSAALLGKHCDVPVYKIDLSRVISKYIGETEKNLERVFSRLEGKNCILFFDEADALFGKRTEVADAKDRYANQEVSYLLQRLEKWNGVVILATNFRQNLDEAFKRRIIKHVAFKPPGKDELMKLWNGHLPESFTFEDDDTVDLLSTLYPFTGANIASVIKKASIKAVSEKSTVLTIEILNRVIKEECVQNDLMQVYRPMVRN